MSTVAGTAGMNIMQRGNFTAGEPQWKLQTDYRSKVGFRVASCRFADGTQRGPHLRDQAARRRARGTR